MSVLPFACFTKVRVLATRITCGTHVQGPTRALRIWE